MSSDDDEDDYAVARMKQLRSQVDHAKVERKMANLPTKEGLLAEKNPNAFTDADLATAKKVAQHLVDLNPQSEDDMKKALKAVQKKFKTDAKKSLILAGYQELLQAKAISKHAFLESYLITKATRSQSGVLVVTVFTSAYPEVDGKKQAFSCAWNCYYCPNEPGQPRSYLLNEPGVRRANRLDFDPLDQFRDRVDALVAIGHPADKVELLVLGGTWESYPIQYRTNFIRDLFYAANTYFDTEKRTKMDLLQEQIINETARCKIIGVTLETRPDTINNDMLVQLRKFGCTRVQLGVQHTDDSVLAAVNRQSTRADAVRAIRLLKDACFKVDIHLMPDLPASNPDNDKRMFDDVLNSSDLQVDQWKIYPCQTTPFTLIKQWYEDGKYASYGLDALIDVLLFAKRRVHPWIRLNRVIRDIPVEYVLHGVEVANLRQLLQIKMQREGKTCQCIRCREVKGDKQTAMKLRSSILVEREFESSRGKEVFLSYETPDHKTIFGFLRLRFPPADTNSPFPELKGCALIRELHVYGNLVVAQQPTAAASASAHPSGGTRNRKDAQHSGLGTKLLVKAELLAAKRGFDKIAVISGVGVRGYYQKRGYVLVDAARGGYLIKDISCTSIQDSFLDRFGVVDEEDYEGHRLKRVAAARKAAISRLLACAMVILAMVVVFVHSNLGN